MKINGVNLDDQSIVVATVEDAELGEHVGFFFTAEELIAYLKECDKPVITDMGSVSVTDIINGAYDITHAYRVELVAKAILQPKVFKACTKWTQLEGILEFLGIYVA